MASQIVAVDEKAPSTISVTSLPPSLPPTPALSDDTPPSKSTEQHSPLLTTATDLAALNNHLTDTYPNPSLTITPQHTLSLTPSPIPTPRPHEVLLHIRCTGICGSDLHLWRHGRIGPLRIKQPCILGHEAAGEVLALGSAAITHLKVGDRVALEPGVPCRTCWLCRAGRYNLCEGVGFCGVGAKGWEGSVRRFMCHDAAFCHVIPTGMGWGRASLLEPLAVVMHAVKELRGEVGLGRGVLVCGAGPIGLIAAKAARASGAWPVVVCDVDEGRLGFARWFVEGCKTWRVDGALGEVGNAEGMRRLFGCEGSRDVERGVEDGREELAPPVVLECTGVESSVVTAAYACRRGGTVMVVGVGKQKMDGLPFMHLSLAEIQLRFINRYRDMWPAAINVLADERVMDLDALVTHTFPLEKAVEAMETCADRSKSSIKVQIVDDCEIDTRC